MISLYSNDKFLSNVIVDLIIQINPNFISHNSALCFASIKVEQSQDHICLLYDKKKIMLRYLSI
jgi:hypothetical protein